MTEQPATRITLYVAMTSIAGSSQDLVIEGDDLPDGWDSMTDDEKEEAIAPTMDVFLANELNYGWTESA